MMICEKQEKLATVVDSATTMITTVEHAEEVKTDAAENRALGPGGEAGKEVPFFPKTFKLLGSKQDACARCMVLCTAISARSESVKLNIYIIYYLNY